jgi:hypothetical protein
MGAIMAEPGSFGSEANNNFHCWPLLLFLPGWLIIKVYYFLIMLVPSTIHFLFPAMLRDRCPKSRQKGQAIPPLAGPRVIAGPAHNNHNYRKLDAL